MIFIPFNDYKKTIGGPSTFMRGLRNCLDQKKIPYIENKIKFRNADKIFFPVSFNRRILKYFKKRKLPIIQRLDGVYYPSKHGKRYLALNKEMKIDYQEFSDFIIFQSKFSKLSCFTMFGELTEDKYKIIYNGADKSIFYPIKKEFSKDKIRFISTGAFRSIDMVEPAILALDEVSKNYNIEFKIIGPVNNGSISKLIERDYINYLGSISKKDIALEIQKSDIFIYTQLNPPCPNSVIESISCGVPVVGFKSGSMKELLFFSTDLLSDVSDDVFQKYEDYDISNFKEKIILCIENYSKFKNEFIENSHLYDFKETAGKYLKIFNNFKNPGGS